MTEFLYTQGDLREADTVIVGPNGERVATVNLPSDYIRLLKDSFAFQGNEYLEFRENHREEIDRYRAEMFGNVRLFRYANKMYELIKRYTLVADDENQEELSSILKMMRDTVQRIES